MARRTGHFFSGTAQRRGEAEIATGVDFAGKAQTQITLDKAFIQFAGITAGRATSFFDFYSNDLTWFGITGSDRGATNLLAYTATFGGGWSATIAMEDPQERRWPIIGLDPAGIPTLARSSRARARSATADLPGAGRAARRAVQRRPPAEELDAGHRGERPRRPDLGLVPAVGRHPPDQRGRHDQHGDRRAHHRALSTRSPGAGAQPSCRTP